MDRITDYDEMMIGEYRDDVLLELIRDVGKSRPRMKPLSDFPDGCRVEGSTAVKSSFPLGTHFVARVKVCQKHKPDGSCIGNPYLRISSEIGVLVKTIPDPGLVARLDPTGVSGRKYYYVRESK